MNMATIRAVYAPYRTAPLERRGTHRLREYTNPRKAEQEDLKLLEQVLRWMQLYYDTSSPRR